MKPEFLENYRNELEDTLDARTYDFDWADLERNLGEAEEQLEDRDFAALGSALQSIIEWIIEGADFSKVDADAHVGRRAIALFWTRTRIISKVSPSPPWPTASAFIKPSSALRLPSPQEVRD